MVAFKNNDTVWCKKYGKGWLTHRGREYRVKWVNNSLGETLYTKYGEPINGTTDMIIEKMSFKRGEKIYARGYGKGIVVSVFGSTPVIVKFKNGKLIDMNKVQDKFYYFLSGEKPIPEIHHRWDAKNKCFVYKR